MRLSMKSFVLPYDIPSSGITPHIPTQQHCNLTKQTQQLMMTFQSSQQSLLHHSIKPTTTTTTTATTTTSKSGRGVRQMGSPRVADRWKEYMGARDWEGLLDPLDENLRDEILRYGSFIEATYRGFNFDPESPSFGSSKYKKKSFFQDCGLPTPGFRLTRHLRVTSGIQVPEWAQSSWSPVKTNWIGYVAVCNDKAMIDHLGRREVVIALRGTATCLEWLENVRATLAPVPVPRSTSLNNDNVDPQDLDGPPMVESGFLSLYTTGTDMWPSLQDSIRMEVSRILELYQDKQPLSITITGHSLGAALATLAAYDIKTTFERAPLVTVISFGGPRVGNQSFRSLVDKQGTKILRVVNPSDLITKVPGFVTDNNEEFVNISNKSTSPVKEIEEKNSKNPRNNNNNKINHRTNRPGKIKSNIISRACKIKSNCDSSHFGLGEVESRIPSNNSGSKKINQLAELCLNWIQQFRVEDTQWWVYAEVGRELRLANSESEQLSYYLGNMDVAKCHDLKTYLNLVEDCPLKNLVRRSLNKLSESCSVHKKETSGIFALLCKQF